MDRSMVGKHYVRPWQFVEKRHIEHFGKQERAYNDAIGLVSTIAAKAIEIAGLPDLAAVGKSRTR